MNKAWLFGLLWWAATAASAEIDYHVTVVPDPGRVEVTMSFAVNGAATTMLQMPNWMPGLYILWPSGNNVHDFVATDARGNALAVTHPDPNSWSLGTSGVSKVKVSYWVPSSGGFNGLSQAKTAPPDFIEISGPTTYLYVDGRKEERCRVTFDAPKQLLVGLDPAGKDTYSAPTYDVLADNPAITGDLLVDTYTLRGRTHSIVLAGDAKSDVDRKALLKDCRFVSASETDFWGDAPYHRYVWLFSVHPGSRGGSGLEHLSSTQISLAAKIDNGTVGLLAHEYFHLWNVKRVRPIDLGPFDYTKLPRTGALWWLEGVTDYYASLLPYRYSEWDRNRFFHSITDNFSQVEKNPAHLTVSPFEASLKVGDAEGGRGNSNGYQISYYNLGWLCGLCLDLEIRSQTHGKHSLDDVAHTLYAECKDSKPGFHPDEIRAQCIRFGGPSLGAFYDRIVMNPGELPVGDELAKAGFKLNGDTITADVGAIPEAREIGRGWLAQKFPNYEDHLSLAGKTTGPDEPLTSPPAPFSYNGFYTKCAYFRGLPILGSPKVSDAAFHGLIRTFNKELARIPDSEFQVLVRGGSHYSIIATTEGQTDLPEYADMRNDPKTDWNKRARGLGGFDTSAAEENILELPVDRYKGESIYIHEFGHTLANFVFAKVDPWFMADLRNAYSTAMKNGLWQKTYSATNSAEYWAEGVQMYFDCARSAWPPNGVHNQVCNREGLKSYDPLLYALVDREFKGNPWRYEGSYNTTHKVVKTN